MTRPSSIGDWIERRTAATPRRTAIVFGDRRVTYAELRDRSRRAAGALEASGVGPGDRVAVLAGTCVEYVEVFFACATLGAIVVPLSWRLAQPELEFLIEDSGARTIVYEAEFADTIKALKPSVEASAYLAIGDADDPSYEAAVSAAPAAPRAQQASPDDVLALFYTSGTTGRPKGAMLTHANVFWTNLDMLLALDMTQEERTLVVLPLFHVGGWNVNTLAAWWKGGTVFLEREFDAGRMLDLVERERITSMMGVPTIYAMLADHPGFDATDLSSLRQVVCGGAPLAESLIRRYLDRGIALTQGYGLTEAAPNVLMLPSDDALERLGSAGKPYFFVEVELRNPDGTTVTPPGEGEVVVRGPNVMKGYWRRPDETAATLRGGWLHTGDVGRADADGFIWIVDRVKDMFISGGENVYPAEIEKALAAHPAVAEAAVIGVPDERWGESGLAIVVPRGGATIDPDELRAFLRERLAAYKVPKSFATAEALPRNATGKLLKNELRERYA